MKVTKIVVTTLAAAVLFSAPAFAGNGNKGNLRLHEAVTVEGKQLTPGDYKLQWEGTGSDVKVNILQGKETVATLPARVVDQPKANTMDGYSSSTDANGAKSLTVIYLSGKKFSLTFEAKETSQATGTQGTK